MNRRTTLKGLVVASAGVFAIEYWASELDVVRDFLSNSFYKPSHQDTITGITDTLIPKSNQLYGALDWGCQSTSICGK